MLKRILYPKKIISSSLAKFQKFYNSNETQSSEKASSTFMTQEDEIIDIGEKSKSLGSLIIVPTPIGNLRDMSIRQYETLLKVDIIACEDTRITGNLLSLIKKKKLKTDFEEKFGVNLNDLKEENQKEEELKDIKEKYEDNFKQNEEELKDLVKQKIEGNTIEDHEKRKKMMEELRIQALKNKAKKILEGVDSLNFLSKYEELEKNYEDNQDYYGLEDEFIIYLKKKIDESKKQKGRGILLSYYKDNENLRIPKLIKAMKYGLKIGLVSDAGTPTISDPGYKLINECLKEGIIVEALPGPNSVTLALSLSGFPSDRFYFEGYLSKTQNDRLEKLEIIKNSNITTILFEAASRLEKTLISMGKIFGEEQNIFLAFELTKMHEKHYRKSIKYIIEKIQANEILLKGEIILIVPPCKKIIEKNLDETKDNNHSVNEVKMAKILADNLDITDKDLAVLLKDILNISKSKSLSIASQVKHCDKKKRDFLDTLKQ